MRSGVRIGIDVGDARIGVARSDPSGLIATPVETVPADEQAFARITALREEFEILEYVVGLPRSLSGGEGPAAAKARAFADSLSRVSGVPVRLVDERLSTVTAESMLREQGRKGQKRRKVVDQVAAVVILQNALETERGTGAPAGELVARAADDIEQD
jgi:putative Holliday junction resolvase